MVRYPLKTFHYKVAEITGANGLTLQQLLEASFVQRPKPSRRTQKLLPEEADEQAEEVVIMYRATHRGLIGGVLQRFKAGAPVLAMIISDDADNYEIRQLAPPVSDQKQRAEFVRNTIYFGVCGNHVALTQKHGFGALDLQSHLQWLLDRCVQDFTGKVLMLKDHIPPEYRSKALQNVKAIAINTRPELKVQEAKPPANAIGGLAAGMGPKAQSWIIDEDPLVSAVLGMLKSHKPGETAAARHDVLELSDAFAKGALKARIVLEYVAGKTEKSPLDIVANDILSTEGLDWEMKLPNQEPYRSTDAKIQRKYSVRCNDDVVDPKSAFEKMAVMISDLVQEAKILPDA